MDKDFLSWHKEFVKRFKGKGDASGYETAPDYHPKDMDAWLGLIEENHVGIREKLGGIAKTFKIDTKDNEPTLAPYQSVYDIMSGVVRLMPDYLDQYLLSYEDFQQPSLKSKRNISGTKHILGYADRTKLDADKRKELEKLTEKLGQLWSQTCKSPKGSGFITLTTDPKAFCLVGRLPICGYSCFGQGNFNSDKKYALAIHKDSFIVYAHRDEALKIDDEVNNNVVARALGVMTKNMSVMNTLNHHPNGYRSSGDKHLTANQTQMEEVAKEFFQAKKVDSQDSKLILTHGIHYGYYTSYSYYDKEKTKPLDKTQKVRIDPRYSKEAHPKHDMYGRWDDAPNQEDD